MGMGIGGSMALQPTTVPSDTHQSYYVTTAGSAIDAFVPIRQVIWSILSTAPAVNWQLVITNSTALTTASTAITYISAYAGTTASVIYSPVRVFPWNNWMQGFTVATLGGGSVTFVRAPKEGEGYSW